MLTEADTCRRFVVPRLQALGWDNEPHSIAEQRTITDGRIVPIGKGFVRKPPKRVDYLLRYTRIFRSPSSRRRPPTKPLPMRSSRPSNMRKCSASNSPTRPTATTSSRFDYFTGIESAVRRLPDACGTLEAIPDGQRDDRAGRRRTSC